MGRRGIKTTVPADAARLENYNQLKEIIQSFASGKTSSLVIVGSPGLSKSKSVELALGDVAKEYLYIKGGHCSPMKMYELLYNNKDVPVVLDDVNIMLGDKKIQQFIRALTETNKYRKIEYESFDRRFEAAGLPSHFTTTSPVCIVTNWWEDSPMYYGIASRAEFFVLDFSWAEVHKYVGEWFWDQEIFDYVGSKIPQLKKPDIRMYIKAYSRKMGKLKHLPWKAAIDSHIDDNMGQVIRTLLADKTYRSDRKRAEKFAADGHGVIQTFYTRSAEIKKMLESPIPKIKLKAKNPPKEARPADAIVHDPDDELNVLLKMNNDY